MSDTKFIAKWVFNPTPLSAVECLTARLERREYSDGQIEGLETQVGNLIDFQIMLFKKIQSNEKFSDEELAEMFYMDIYRPLSEDEI